MSFRSETPPRWTLAVLATALLAACGTPQARVDAALDRGRFDRAEALLLRYEAQGGLERERMRLLGERALWPELLAHIDAWRGRPDDGSEGVAVDAGDVEVAAWERRAATEMQDAGRWLNAWLLTVDVPVDPLLELPLAQEALGTVAGRSPETVDLLVPALVQSAGATESPTDDVATQSVIEEAMYRLLYLRRYALAEALLPHLAALGAPESVWMVHALALAWESGDGRAASTTLRAIDPDAVAGAVLARQWESRGALRAAGAMWARVAELESGESAALAWRSCADARYASGQQELAREALESSIAAVPNLALANARAASQTARLRSDEVWGRALLERVLDAQPCGPPASTEVLEAETQWIRHAAADSRLPADHLAMRARIEARLAACPDAALANVYTDSLIDAGRYADAWLVLELLPAQTPNAEDLTRLAVAAEDLPSRQAIALERIGAWLDTLPTPLPDDQFDVAMNVLHSSEWPELAALRDAWLQRLFEGPRPTMQAALIRASDLHEAARDDERRELLARAVAASADPLQAQIQVIYWLNRMQLSAEAADMAEALAQSPEADRPLDMGEDRSVSVREEAWRLAMMSLVDAGQSDRLLNAALAWAEARGADLPETWSTLWSLRSVWAGLDPGATVTLSQRCIDGGFDTPQVRTALADAQMRLGDVDRALDTYTAIIETYPASADAILDSLLDGRHLDAAQSLLARYIAVHGESLEALTWTARLETARWFASDGAIVHVGLARRAYRRLLDGGYAPRLVAEEIPLRADFVDLGYEARLRLVEAPEPNFELVEAMILAGEDWAVIEPWFQATWDDVSMPDHMSMIIWLSQYGYPAEAGRWALRLVSTDRDSNAGLSYAADFADIIVESGDAALINRFIDDHLLHVADTLSMGVREIGPDWAWSGDVEVGAERFYRLAAELLLRVGRWQDAADAAALSLRTRNAYSGQVLAMGLRATWRAQAGELDENDVSYWVGLAGGTADTWNSAAMALSGMDVPMARLALTRAMTLDPSWGRWVALRVMLGPPWEDDAALVEAWRTWLDQPDPGRAQDASDLLGSMEPTLLEQGRVALLEALLEQATARFGNHRDLVLAVARVQAATGQIEASARTLDGRRGVVIAEPLALFNMGATETALDAWQNQVARTNAERAYELEAALGREFRLRRGGYAWQSLEARTLEDLGRSNARWWRAQTAFQAGRPGETLVAIQGDSDPDALDLLHRLQAAAFAGEPSSLRRVLAEQRPADWGDAEIELVVRLLSRVGGANASPISALDWAEQLPASEPATALVQIWLRWLDGDVGGAMALYSERIASETAERPEWQGAPWLAAAARWLRAVARAGYVAEARALAESSLAPGVGPGEGLLVAVELTLQDPSASAAEREAAIARWMESASGHPELSAQLYDAMNRVGAWQPDLAQAEAAARAAHRDDLAPLAFWSRSVRAGIVGSVPGTPVSIAGLAPGPDAARDANLDDLAELRWTWAGVFDIAPGVPAMRSASFGGIPELEREPGTLHTAITAELHGDLSLRAAALNRLLDRWPGSQDCAVMRSQVTPLLTPVVAQTLDACALHGAEPDWPWALQRMSEAFAQYWPDREAWLARAVAHAEQTPALWQRLVERLREVDPEGESWALLAEADVDRTQPLTVAGLAQLAVAAGDEEGARDLLRTLVELPGDRLAALRETWSLYTELGLVDLLDTAATQAATALPAALEPLLWRTAVAVARQDLEAAHALSERLLDDSVAFEVAPSMLRVLAAGGHRDDAWAWADLIARTGWLDTDLGSLARPDDALSTTLLIWAETNPEMGLQWWNERFPTLATHPELSGATFALVRLYEEAGDEAARINVYERDLALHPTEPVAWNNLAWALAESGERLDEAIEMAQYALAIDPSYSSNTADTLAWALFQAGRIDEAAAWMRNALAHAVHEGQSWSNQRVFASHWHAIRAAQLAQRGDEAR